MIKRYETKKIYVGDVAVGGDAPISVQSMTYTKTSDIEATLEQIKLLHFAGADIVRVAVPDMAAAYALKEIKKRSSLPIVADIHFNYKLALIAAEDVDCIRFNPGNIGDKSRIKEIVKACQNRNLPVRIGVNCGSLEEQFEDIKISLKASDVERTVDAYRMLRPKNNYPFHLGVTEAGTLFHATVKSAIGLGTLLLDGIGDTMRISITGELEKEIEVGRAILKDAGIINEGLNIISCPTCGRIEADLVSAVKEVEEATRHIKTPLNVSVMGCVVNAIGEAKSADVAIAYGKGSGLIIKKGEIIAKLDTKDLLPRFLEEVEKEAKIGEL